MRKFLLLGSVLASIICIVNPASSICTIPECAADYRSEDIAHVKGAKGTYIVNLSKGTYQACIYSGGCISLGRKHLLSKSSLRYSSAPMRWKNGEYIYSVGLRRIEVTKNGRVVFEDRYGIPMFSDDI